MTRLPRDLTGDALAKALVTLGSSVTRQTGSHMRLTTQQRGEHHVTIPRHDPPSSLAPPRTQTALHTAQAPFPLARPNPSRARQ